MEPQEIKIFGKTYKVKPFSSSVNMQEAAAMVDDKMKELARIKSRSSTLDLAVLTALNLGYELMELKQGNQSDDDTLNERLEDMTNKLGQSLKAIEKKGFIP